MSLDKNKTDKELGLMISDYLKTKGVETPKIEGHQNDKEKIAIIDKSFKIILETLGLDLSDDSLKDTSRRVSRMFVDEVFWGLQAENFPKITDIDNKMGYDSMVIERNINVQSKCEHHFVEIDGLATVAYVPKNKVLGLSKLNRVVEYFSKRPQVQERLTEQIYYSLEYILETSDIAVLINAKHFCVKSRGVEDTGSDTFTSKLGGKFKNDPILRTEFFTMIK